MKIINPNAPGRWLGSAEFIRIATPEDRYNLIGEPGEMLVCESNHQQWKWDTASASWIPVTGSVGPDGSTSFAGPLASVGGVSTYTDFTILADGTPPVKHDDFPLPIRTYYPTASAVPFVVRDGRLQSDTENTGKTTVCYTETDLVGQVSVIGADISFKSNGGGAGTIALCAWGDSSLVDTFADGRIPATGCHFIIQRDFWSYQVWDHDGAGTQLVTLKNGIVPLIPQDETTTFRVEVKFDGDSAIVSFPEYGYSQRVTDPRIRTLGRRYACWETYQISEAGDKPQFARIWASSARQAEMASSAVIPQNQVHAVQSATTGNFAITAVADGAAAEIDASTYIEFIFPASGKVLLEYIAMIDQTVAGTMLMNMCVVNTDGTGSSYAPAQPSNTVTKQLRHVAVVYSFPTRAGNRCQFRPRAWMLSGGAATISRSPSGGLNPVLKVTPLP